MTNRDCPEFLFEMRINLAAYQQPAKLAIVRAFEDYARPYGPTHTALRIELAFGGKTIFPDGRIGVPNHESIDGNGAKELALSLLAMKPGDTDADFFADYTPEQLAFVEAYGEEIDRIREDRFCDENGNLK